MDLQTALEWAAARHSAVLITIRRNGRPQSSDIAYAVQDGLIRVSVTDDRAKTRNLRRDGRAVIHITSPDSWSYVSFEGDVELSAVAEVPGDDTCEELAQLLRAIQGEEHSDWNEFNQAMVDDKRLAVRFKPTKATGQVN